MKSEALYYAVAAAVFAVALGLFVGTHADLDVGSILGWATAGVLLAMVPIEYRRAFKRNTGKV
jgi:hypothetical protein